MVGHGGRPVRRLLHRGRRAVTVRRPVRRNAGRTHGRTVRRTVGRRTVLGRHPGHWLHTWENILHVWKDGQQTTLFGYFCLNKDGKYIIKYLNNIKSEPLVGRRWNLCIFFDAYLSKKLTIRKQSDFLPHLTFNRVFDNFQVPTWYRL